VAAAGDAPAQLPDRLGSLLDFWSTRLGPTVSPVFYLVLGALVALDEAPDRLGHDDVPPLFVG